MERNPLHYLPASAEESDCLLNPFIFTNTSNGLCLGLVCVELVVPVGFPRSKHVHIGPIGVSDWSRVTHDPDV